MNLFLKYVSFCSSLSGGLFDIQITAKTAIEATTSAAE